MFNQSACIVGGGFYGVVIALYLKRVIGFNNVKIYEQESELLSRSSFNNQARVHNGYHYPRSFTTAFRSKENFKKFNIDWSNAIFNKFNKYYAIARKNSKVTSYQFSRFCKDVGIPLFKPEKDVQELFNSSLISDIYKVEEHAFNALKLREWSYEELTRSNINCEFNNKVLKARLDEDKGIEITVKDKLGDLKKSSHSVVFNCTYSGLIHIEDYGSSDSGLRLKHEITELALIEPPSEIRQIGITVIDGPFFSMMPFPAKCCYSISHVRYTPHSQWIEKMGMSPYEILKKRKLETRADRMIRDSSRYVPAIAKSTYLNSLYEIKTVLEKNENDDGRPILFRESLNIPRFYSVLGGKIDNVYDILESIDNLKNLIK